IIIYGFSQGVSVAMRWLLHSGMRCDKLIINAGKIPHEIKPNAYEHFGATTEVHHIVGQNDPYLNPAVEAIELNKIAQLFQHQKVFFHKPNLDHSVAVDVLKSISTKKS
ncbi:MAG: hypothetical protein RQ756_04790, partial [Flavobacteriaceae bacterium]|nr:hypothetical protein [Flavobacteriaceae bacterium]